MPKKYLNTYKLMIGDWVCVYSNDRTETHPFRVNEIVERGVYDSHKGFVEEKDIEPIPLTPEILEKNGFNLMHGFRYNETYPTYGWGDNTDKKYISVDVTFYDDEPINEVMHLVKIYRNSIKEDGVDSIHSCDIDYVHELQHALKVCKIEKEIAL